MNEIEGPVLRLGVNIFFNPSLFEAVIDPNFLQAVNGITSMVLEPSISESEFEQKVRRCFIPSVPFANLSANLWSRSPSLTATLPLRYISRWISSQNKCNIIMIMTVCVVTSFLLHCRVICNNRPMEKFQGHHFSTARRLLVVSTSEDLLLGRESVSYHRDLLVCEP